MRDRAAMLPGLQIVAQRAVLANLTLLQLRSAMGVPVHSAALEAEELAQQCARLVEGSFADMGPALRAELLPIIGEELRQIFALIEPGAAKLDAALA